MEIAEQVIHHHPRPPVIVVRRAVEAIVALALEDGIAPLRRLGFQLLVVQSPSQRNKPLEIIRPLLPVLAGAAAPRATLELLVPVLAIGAAVVLPPFYWLLRVFKGQRPR
jgi:hypothetical protein